MTALAALLPVRLETRFIPPGYSAERPEIADPEAPGTWRLRLRIVPETISLDRHDPVVTPAEKRGLAYLWGVVETAPDPGDPAGSAQAAALEESYADAFTRLAAQVGPGRAAWLVRSVPVSRGADGIEVGDVIQGTERGITAAVVRGFPGAIDVWCVWQGEETPEVLEVLHPDRALLEDPPPGVPDWLISWEAATTAGLAAEIELPRDPEGIAVLGVSGLSESGDDALGALLGAHAAAGRLSISGPGQATSIVHGGPVLPTGQAAQEWLDPVGAAAGLAERTVGALLGDAAATLGPVRAMAADDLDALLVRASFPALWGYSFAGVLGLADPAELPRLWRWASERFRPQGAYATLVVDGAAYGVLPVVDPAAVAAAGPGPAVDPVAGLLDALERAIGAWGRAAATDSGAVGGGVRDVVRTLRRGPVPGGVGSTRMTPVDLLAALTDGDVQGARDTWDHRHHASIDVLGDAPGRRYWAAAGRVRRLGLPLIVPAPLRDAADATTAVEELTDLLDRWRDDSLFEPVELGNGPVRVVYAHPDIRDSSFHRERDHPGTLLHRLLIRSIALAGVSLDVLRQTEGVSLNAQWGSEPATELLERLVSGGGSTHARRHLNALAHVLLDDGLDGGWAQTDPHLVDDLTWLTHDGFDRVRDLPYHCLDDELTSRTAHRALLALLETAAGRWDTWWDAVGAAQVADIRRTHPGPAASGIHGWVDLPWRGRPGPGPGGLLLAPSLAQAATAAALRDRSVHDDDGRWDLAWDSSTVGPARALLADIAQGWHPAEAVGRLIEEHLVRASATPSVGSAELRPLRAAFPLRTGQGHFGCCHGLRVLAATAAELPTVGPPGALATAIAEVRAILDTASDLLLAESVHGVLAGRPERAAIATEALAGQLRSGPLSVLDSNHPRRTVHTLVLVALPATPASPGSTGAVAAAPGFDAALRAAEPGTAWRLTVSGSGTPVSVELADLGLAPVHTAVLDDEALGVLAILHLGLHGTDVSADGVEPADGAETARRLCAALSGRPPDPTELQPPGAGQEDHATPVDVVAASEAAAAFWEERVSALGDLAEALASDVGDATAQAHRAWRDFPSEVEQRVDLPGLAGHVLALAAWGLAPHVEIADLLGPEGDRRDVALAATLAHLERGASELAARVAAARGGPASGAVLAQLGAGRLLPVGTRAAMSLLGEALEPAVGTDTVADWLPTMARVRRALEPLPALLELPGVGCSAVDPQDPWRLAALTPPAQDDTELRPPDPRLTVMVSVGAPTDEAEVLVLDAFAEPVPDPYGELGVAFDAATPSAVPPQALLLVSTPDPAVALTAADLPAAVLRARTVARARMAETATLRAAGLGPLAAACLLPQDGDTGCALDDPNALPGWDQPAALVPMPTHEDTADVIAATTADAAWMLGVQWRLGEHLGEDAASPLEVSLDVVSTPIAEPLLSSQPAEVVAERSGWQRDRLHHTATWGSDGESLVVDRHDAGTLDWWSAQRSHPVVSAQPPRAEEWIPSRLRWPGQPRRRYWEVDDATLDPIGHGPDRGHPATLHLVDVISRLGDDWYRVALRGAAGEFVGVSGARLTDAAGGTWDLRTEPGWSLFAVGGADPSPADLPPGAAFHRVLPVLLGGSAALEGEPMEEVALAVDEDENLLWAAVLRSDAPPGTGPGPDGANASLGLTALSRVLHTDPLSVDWALGGTPPVDRVPYLYGWLVPPGVVGHAQDVFVRAQLRDPASGQLLDLPQPRLFATDEDAGGEPHVLRPLAVPASGTRLVRRVALARDVSGAPLLWDRSERVPLDVAVDVDMPWDVLTRRIGEEPPVTAAE